MGRLGSAAFSMPMRQPGGRPAWCAPYSAIRASKGRALQANLSQNGPSLSQNGPSGKGGASLLSTFTANKSQLCRRKQSLRGAGVSGRPRELARPLLYLELVDRRSTEGEVQAGRLVTHLRWR